MIAKGKAITTASIKTAMGNRTALVPSIVAKATKSAIATTMKLATAEAEMTATTSEATTGASPTVATIPVSSHKPNHHKPSGATRPLPPR